MRDVYKYRRERANKEEGARLREAASMIVRRGIGMYFFFSSRRRHTRLQGDWSSDVCSSDLVNVAESSIAREADIVLPTYAGPEIGVASTKAFTCQLAALASFAIAAGVARGSLSEADEKTLCASLLETPRHMAEFLKQEPAVKQVAEEVAKARDVLYMGRGASFPLALEGALKLKEISYIHAEGYAAGEMKHGPIALIDEAVPILVLSPHALHFEKTISHMQGVMARGGQGLLVSDQGGNAQAGQGLGPIQM